MKYSPLSLATEPGSADYAHGRGSFDPPLYELAVRVPFPVAAKLLDMANRRGMTRATLMRRLITDATGIETGRVAPARDFVRAPEGGCAPEKETVLDLWRRGFKAQQISARLGMKYRDVLDQIYTADPIPLLCGRGNKNSNKA